MSSNPNNSGNPDHVVEDRPEMRSVSMMSPPAVPMMRPMRSGFTKSPMTVAPTRLTAESKVRTALSAGWKVQSAPDLPPIYFLERTHAHVDAPAPQVASRIADCLYKESIAVRYSPDEVLASAKTACNVQFDIRLWSANGKTLVEVQRTDGCSRSFHLAAKSVLKAAKGQSSSSRSPSPVLRVPDAVRTESLEVNDSCTQEGLEIALDMINQGRPDMALLGMESLAQITEADRCQCFAAKFVLGGELGDKLMSIVETPLSKSAMEHEIANEAMIKSHCLSVIRNSLLALQKSATVSQTLADRPELTRSSFLLSLVDIVRKCDCCPHSACKATQILQVLIANGPSCCKRRAEDLAATVEQALSCRHANLEKECQKLQVQL